MSRVSTRTLSFSWGTGTYCRLLFSVRHLLLRLPTRRVTISACWSTLIFETCKRPTSALLFSDRATSKPAWPFQVYSLLVDAHARATWICAASSRGARTYPVCLTKRALLDSLCPRVADILGGGGNPITPGLFGEEPLRGVAAVHAPGCSWQQPRLTCGCHGRAGEKQLPAPSPSLPPR